MEQVTDTVGTRGGANASDFYFLTGWSHEIRLESTSPNVDQMQTKEEGGLLVNVDCVAICRAVCLTRIPQVLPNALYYTTLYKRTFLLVASRKEVDTNVDAISHAQQLNTCRRPRFSVEKPSVCIASSPRSMDDLYRQ